MWYVVVFFLGVAADYFLREKELAIVAKWFR